jgi:hypothetical protein
MGFPHISICFLQYLVAVMTVSSHDWQPQRSQTERAAADMRSGRRTERLAASPPETFVVLLSYATNPSTQAGPFSQFYFYLFSNPAQ